jgi:predicted MFS family arabinose efflux permease
MTMDPSRTSPNLDKAWRIPIGGAVALTVGNGPVGVFAFGILMGPLSAEFGWSRASLSSALAVSALASAMSLPIIGLLMDRYGVRRLLMIAICLFGLNVAALGLTQSLPAFLVLMTLCGITGAAQSPIGYVKCISGHFERHRGLAIGIAMTGIGIGTMLIPQFVQWLVNGFGWRAGYLGLGLLTVVVALPPVIFMLLAPHSEVRLDAPPAPGRSLREAVKHRSFWCLAVAVLLVSASVNGTLVHVVPLLVDRGWDATTAARMLIVGGGAGIAGRLLAGYWMDRIFGPYVAAGFFALAIVGLYLLVSGISPVAGIVAIGLAAGAEVDMMGFFVPRYFGLRRFGQIYGVLFALFTVGGGLGVLLLGTLHSRLHSYDMAFLVCGIGLGTACVLTLAIGPYAFYPAATPRERPLPPSLHQV